MDLPQPVPKLASPEHQRSIWIFYAILAAAAIGTGFSDSLFSNYFKDAYQVTALQRGLIEFPRELPGVLSIFLVSVLAFMGDLRLAMLAHSLVVIGLALLGFLTPPYLIMLMIIFFHSIGQHLWFPLQNSIGMSLIHDEANAGRLIGRFNGVSTAFGMLASLLVFLAFRSGFFSFTADIKTTFLIGGIASLTVVGLLYSLDRHKNQIAGAPSAGKPSAKGLPRPKFVFRWQYRNYYVLAIIFGVQKQIMMVYAPWVLIDLLGKKADTLSLLLMLGSFAGIFFTPALGRWLDRYGIRKMLFLDAYSFIGVYIAYGVLASGFTSGVLPKTGWAVLTLYALFILDRMSMQMGMVRSLYLRSIALTPEDISPTLVTGQSMDHVVSITMATLGGVIWTTIGPQYVFFIAAALSLANLFVAIRVKDKV
ncbi:MAG: MFS transporter [Clostridia bacterium]|nr:MFS transporter [Clostridia bacterium]